MPFSRESESLSFALKILERVLMIESYVWLVALDICDIQATCLLFPWLCYSRISIAMVSWLYFRTPSIINLTNTFTELLFQTCTYVLEQNDNILTKRY